MNLWRLIRAGLAHHWRIHVALALGVAAGTAVLTGALVVGDSMQESLARLTLERLGRIDQVVLADRFFRRELAAELAATPGFADRFRSALPAILAPATLQNPAAPGEPRAPRASVVACDERFWKLGLEPTDWPWPAAGGIVLNAPLAERLQARVGDEVLLRVGQANLVPADSPLGRKTETVRSRRLTVRAIVPAKGLGRFTLRPNQQAPLCAFVNLDELESMLEQPGRANAILVEGRAPSGRAATERGDLAGLLRPKLTDFGLEVAEVGRGYFNLTSQRMMIEPAIEAQLLEQLAGRRVQPALTYLANWIRAGQGRGKIPYSTVTALDPAAEPPLGPLRTTDGKRVERLADDEIVLNAWAVDDLAAQGAPPRPGDPIELIYFEPESAHGQVSEQTARFRLRGVVQLAGAADDPHWTPQVSGVTDQASIDNWNPPFPYDGARVRTRKPHDEDDAYWKRYQATPKAFVSLSGGRKLWGSRFGQATSIRVASRPGESAAELAATLRVDPARGGFQVLPVKRDGLAAAGGTTPFNLLFLGFSFFIIAAAVMLIALLLRLAMARRAGELGVLVSVGWPRRRVAALMTLEAAAVAALGGALGAALGVGYAGLMIWGLTTWWLAAIRAPFVELAVRPATLAIGAAGGIAVALATVAGTVRWLRGAPPVRLLRGQIEAPPTARPRARWTSWGAAALLVAAVAMGLLAARLGDAAQAGAFFAAGAAVLAAGILLLAAWLRRPHAAAVLGVGRWPLWRLAARNGERHPGRSLLTAGLVAAAAFLIVAISAFQLDATALGVGKHSGSGGFSLVAELDQPIYQDLNLPAARRDLALTDQADRRLADAQTIALRVQAGDDASCLNLYKPGQPRALGVPRALVERGGFDWAGSLADSPQERANPWRLLTAPPAGEDAAVPVVLDANTAAYSLHLGLGDQLEILDGVGQTLRLRIVGLLKNSLFQGDVLLGDEPFRRHFPGVSGFRLLLVDTRGAAPAPLAKDLEESLGDYGLTAQPSVERLAEFMQVQNTYLSTFQSLGGLGLLLGTFGLAAVQLRSVLERRGELALLRAAGFRRARLARLVLAESLVLLAGGLLLGVLAALVAVAPHWLAGSALVPWGQLAATLALVLAVGLLVGLWTARSALRAEILPALRGD